MLFTSVKTFKALLPLWLGVTNEQTNKQTKYYGMVATFYA